MLPLVELRIQHAETSVAVGLERAHADRLGQSKGLAVLAFGLLDRRGSAVGSDVAEEPPGFAEGLQHIAQVEAEINGLLARGAVVGEMLKGRQGRSERKSPIAMAVAVVELEGDDLTATLDDHRDGLRAPAVGAPSTRA